LQGILEKIHFQRLVRQRPFQSAGLLAQRGFSPAVRLPVIYAIDWLQLIAPRIQQSPMHTQFLRQRDDILAAPQPFDDAIERQSALSVCCQGLRTSVGNS
jgi:hypothetical protein